MRARLLAAGFLYAASALADQTVSVGPGTAFSPSTVTISPGEKVTWVWVGELHSSTSDATTGPDAWDSGVISTGSFDHTFLTAGTFPYYCVLHGAAGGIGMSGVVQAGGQVTQTASPTATPTATPSLTATASPTATPSPTVVSSPTATPPLTTTPTATATPPPSATAAPSATATPTITPFTPVADPTHPSGAAVPTLGGGGLLALALGLAALSYVLLSRAAR